LGGWKYHRNLSAERDNVMKVLFRKKLYGCVIMSLLCAGVLCVLAGTDDETAEVTRVGQNLYKLRFDNINLIASVGPDGVLLSDTAFENIADELRAELIKLGNDDVKIIINTHWHSDHTDGNKAFGRRATIIAHRNVRKRLSQKQVSDYWGEEHDPLPEYARPNLTFSDKLAIHFNGEDIEIIHFPNGHSDGDVIVYFKKAGVVHLGDLLFSDGFPAIDFENGGNPVMWAKNLQRIIASMPKDVKFIAGHGRDYTVEDLTEYHDMIRSTVKIIHNAMVHGKSIEEMKKARILKRWAKWGKEMFPCDKWIEMVYHSLNQF